MSKSGAFVIRYGRLIAAVLLIWLCTSVALLASALSAPVTVSESTVPALVKHEASIDYTFNLRPGKLYPTGATADTKAKKIIASLVSSAAVRFADRVKAQGATLTSGSYSVVLRVTAGDLWSKEYQLLKQTKLDPSKPDVAASVSLPLSLIIADITAIEKEIGMGSPTGSYVAETRLVVDLTASGSDGLSHQYIAAFPFTLSGGVLTPPPTLNDSKTYEVKTESTRAGTRDVLGLTVLVTALRATAWTSLALSLVATAAAAALAIRHRRLVGVPDPGRPFRDRIVRVTGIGDQSASLAVRVAGLRELARIAEEAQAAIMLVMPEDTDSVQQELRGEPSPGLLGRKYFVVTNGVIYYAV